MPGGRPTKFSPKAAEAVLLLIEAGFSVHTITRELPRSQSTLDRWAVEDEVFALALGRAKLAGNRKKAA